MKYFTIGKNKIELPKLSIGCLRITEISMKDTEKLIMTAMQNGANHFDNADIYGGYGTCEELMATAISNLKLKREDYMIQTKCGISNEKSRYFTTHDWSKKHIMDAVEGSLKRLNTDYIDTLLLHRYDPLMIPEEVAEAFDTLYDSGKVKSFGVSNQNPWQTDFIKKYIKQELIVNQMQFSIMHTGMIDSGIYVNMKNEQSILHDGGVMEYARLNDMAIQAWSPYQYGMFDGTFMNNDKFPELNQLLDRIAEKYSVTDTAIATAWILRLPVKMQVVTGTTKASRLNEICSGSNIELTRDEWYEIYAAAGNVMP
ncbi:MAG: aldo/keto reductase [Christensenellaceae bacterium]